MFQLGDLTLRILKLLLRIFSKTIPDIFYNGSGIVAIFIEESLEFFPEYNNIRPFFLSMPVFILCPTSADAISKKEVANEMQLSPFVLVISK